MIAIHFLSPRTHRLLLGLMQQRVESTANLQCAVGTSFFWPLLALASCKSQRPRRPPLFSRSYSPPEIILLCKIAHCQGWSPLLRAGHTFSAESESLILCWGCCVEKKMESGSDSPLPTEGRSGHKAPGRTLGFTGSQDSIWDHGCLVQGGPRCSTVWSSKTQSLVRTAREHCLQSERLPAAHLGLRQ